MRAMPMSKRVSRRSPSSRHTKGFFAASCSSLPGLSAQAAGAAAAASMCGKRTNQPPVANDRLIDKDIICTALRGQRKPARSELFSMHFVAEPRGLRAPPRLRCEHEGAGVEPFGQERTHDAFERCIG